MFGIPTTPQYIYLMTLTRAAIAQLCSTSDKAANLIQISKCAAQARDVGASMLFLPECFGFMSDETHKTIHFAEDLSSNAIQTTNNDSNDRIVMDGLRSIAREYNLWLSGGGIHEIANTIKDDDTSNSLSCDHKRKVYNTHIIVNNEGSIVAKYRKIHLFDVCIPDENVDLRESATTEPGDLGVVVCDSPIGKLGLATCYDVRFPEHFAMLKEKGAKILLVPSAFTVPTGQAHWHVLLRARAIENQCYVLAAAQCGRHNGKRTSYGHSLAIDPWGTVLADAGGIIINSDGDSNESSEFVPSIVICDIDLEHVASIRKRMPIDEHRKNANEFMT